VIRIAVILVLVGLPALTGCSRSDPPLESVSLPGFSIELPPGRVTKTSRNPLGGKHAIELPAPSFRDIISGGEVADREMEVHWSQNRVSHELWKSMLLPVVMTQLPGASTDSKVVHEEMLDDSSWLTMVQNSQGNVGIGVVTCSESFAVYVTYVRYTDLDRQIGALREIVKSVRCNEDATVPARAVIATRLPPSLGRTPDTAAQIYLSLDGERLALNYAMKDLQSSPELYHSLLETAVSMRFQVDPADVEYTELESARTLLPRKTSLTRLRLRTGGQPFYVGAILCDDQAMTVVGFWESSQPSDRIAQERLSQFGCPGDPSSPSPTFASLVDAACGDGDQEACALKSAGTN
jgi:hypothetical protein